jgi:hypothetical protein
MKVIGLFITIFLFFSSCNQDYNERQLYGIYAPVNYINTYDTLELSPKNIYHRKVYNQKNKLVLKMDGKWVMKTRNEIQFYSYFLNLDRNLSKFPELLKDTDMNITTYFQISKGIISFCVGYAEDKNCYQKVK